MIIAFLIHILLIGLGFIAGILIAPVWHTVRSPQNVPGKPVIGYMNRDKFYYSPRLFFHKHLFTQEALAEARARAERINLEKKRAKRAIHHGGTENTEK